jgi:PhnB protein
MQVQPYLFFEGRCDEALDFYREKLGAEVTMLMRFKDAPAAGKAAPEGCSPTPEGAAGKVMHCSFRIGETTVLASDGMCKGRPQFAGVALTINARDAEEVDKLFNALADGGQIQMPLATTFFSPRFGMVADRFGVSWMVVAGHENA